ncbi:hypothetical protein QAD02_018272 [Eretmocerus hayati]|uniref:Uncharacterized protein n=1 Tax=Eretmocerus hayati TaxID=131215 RepID=A0ACC2PFY0_9HYME|nr:hypothetical protein QAD02_018272 [Eretmocerus hayati]
MSRPSKAVTQAKKVAPPAVPNDFRLSGSSFGSAGYSSSEDGCFLPGALPSGANTTTATTLDSSIGSNGSGSNIGVSGASNNVQSHHHHHAGPVAGGNNGPDDVATYGIPPGKSPGAVFSHAGFSFPSGVQVGKYSLTEDQGIDMTQSPGRDSPGSSGSGSGSGSRHSTASLDSGRASGYHLAPRSQGSSGLISSPRCSISSLGSHPDRLNDLDLVHAWLKELQFEEYFQLFASAGYDLTTITRMTPEDLTAIGIKKPNHRKRLKAEIDNLNVGDGLPEHVPSSLEEWLRLIKLEEYLGALHQQGMRSVEDVTTLTWEDLEDIGIVRLGHQKKLLLAIKRVKDIRAGKRIQSLDLARLPPHPGHTQDVIIQRGPPDLPSPDEDCSSPVLRSFQRPKDCSSSSNCTSSAGSTSSVNSVVSSWRSVYAALPPGLDYGIIGRSGVSAHSRGKSLESLEDMPLNYPPSPAPPYSLHHHQQFLGSTQQLRQTFHPQVTTQHPLLDWRPRSYDDGDITPTNDHSYLMDNIGGGTLPRPRHCLVKPRPVAKIQATHQTSCKSLPRDMDNKYQLTYGLESSPSLKRRPPSPPRRQSSAGSIQNSTNDIFISCSRPVTTLELSQPHDQTSQMIPLRTLQPQQKHLSPPQGHLGPKSNPTTSHNWANTSHAVDEHELIASLALQHRNGSDASFKSNSSAESDSLPFANENAGTIKQRANRAAQEYANANQSRIQEPNEPVDVLSDIGNMLTNLTNELDAMLEEEKRQGLNT